MDIFIKMVVGVIGLGVWFGIALIIAVVLRNFGIAPGLEMVVGITWPVPVLVTFMIGTLIMDEI